MRREFHLFLVISFIFVHILAISGSYAQDLANLEGAQRLKAITERFLENYKTSQEFSSGSLILDGEIVIEPAGRYYAVTLPHITIIDQDGIRAEIGMIAFNAIPDKKAGQWKISAALPTPIVYVDPQNKIIQQIDIGSQRMAGIWNESMAAFVKQDALYKDIKFQDFTNNTTINADQIGLQVDLKESQTDIWSGPTNLSASNIQLKSDGKDGTYSFSVDSINSNMNLFSFSATENQEMQDKIQDLATKIDADDLENPNKAHQIMMFDLFSQMMDSTGNGFTSQTNIKGIDVNIAANQQSQSLDIAANSVGFGFDMTGFKENNVTVALRLSFDDLSQTPANGDYAELNPSQAKLNLNMNNFPYNEFKDLAANILQTSQQNPNASSLAGVQAMMMIPQLLTASATNITIKESFISNSIYNIALDLILSANAKSAFGASGNGNAEIAGLSRLIDRITAKMQNSDGEKQQGYKNTLASLLVLNTLGNEQKNEQGKPVKSYAINLNEQGQFIVNGKDINQFMQSQTGLQ